MLYCLLFRKTQSFHERPYSLRTKNPHQVVFQGNIKLSRTGIALTARSPPKLIVDPSGLMPLGADNMKSAEFFYAFAQNDVCPSSGHVCGNRYRFFFARFGNNRRFFFMIFSV